MSIESILKSTDRIEHLRKQLYEDIKLTYPEGTLVRFNSYGKLFRGYVSHVHRCRVYLCDHEGTAFDCSPLEDELVIVEETVQ